MVELLGEIPEEILAIVHQIRTGRMELSSPEAAALRAWLEEDASRKDWFRGEIDFDFWMQSRFQQLEVPEELAARVLSRLAMRRRETVSMASIEKPENRPRSLVRKLGKLLGHSRVQFGLGAATAVLLTAGLYVWASQWFRGPTVVREPLDAVIVKSIEWYQELMADDNWEKNFADYMAEYPLDDILPRQPKRARPYFANWGKGIVYDLTEGHLAGSLLFVVRPSRPFVDPGRLSNVPVYVDVDSRHSVGAGQHNGLVYILVVNGEPRDYHLLFTTALMDE